MIVSLRGNPRSLHTRQNLFCLRQRQPQIGDLGKPGGSIDLYQVDTICRDVGPVSTSRKIQPMHDPPVKKTKTVVSLPAPYPQSLDSPDRRPIAGVALEAGLRARDQRSDGEQQPGRGSLA